MRRRVMLGTTTRHLALLAAVPLLLTACGDSGTDDDAGGEAAQETPSSAVPSPSGPPPGPPCPDELASDDGAGVVETEEPAAETPDLPEATAAWRCQYAYGDDAEGESRWERRGEPVEVPAADLGALAEALARLEPAPADQVCTMDLGPRWMVVLEHDGGRTGVVADDFGCRDVRLTDDPATVPPGAATTDGVPAGVLTGPPELLDVVSGGRARP